MYIYNVTTKVSQKIHEAWVLWMQTVHTPEVMATGCFKESRMLRLLDVDDSEGPTYAMQYVCEARSDYERYINEHSTVLRKSVMDRWGDQTIAFRSFMEIVN